MSTINDEIDRLRHSATAALLTRRDVIIVASVSAIYGLGSPEQYEGQLLRLVQGVQLPLDFAVRRLVDIQYERNEVNLIRGRFRVRGDTLEVFPSYEETVYRVEYFGDEVERIIQMNPVTGEVIGEQSELWVLPATHYVTERQRMEKAIVGIEDELVERLAELEHQGKLLEAQRLRMRTNYDLEMMREIGTCAGIENYSRHLDGRAAGPGPVHAARLLPRRLPHRGRREPCDHPADPRAVRRATGAARTCWSTTASVCPAPSTTGPSPSRSGTSERRRRAAVGHTGGMGDRALHPGCRADHPPHRAGRPGGPGPSHQGPDRRPAWRRCASGPTTTNGSW